MERSKNYITFIIIAIILIIGITTCIKVYKSHIENAYKVITKKICEATSKCYGDNICNGDNIKLEVLISNKYIEKQVDPKTKEYVDVNTSIYYKNSKCIVDIK